MSTVILTVVTWVSELEGRGTEVVLPAVGYLSGEHLVSRVVGVTSSFDMVWSPCSCGIVT